MADESHSEHIEYIGAGPDLKTIYANVAGVKGGPFDAALDFGYVIAPNEDDEMAPDWLIRVAMSWDHLIALHELIGNQLENLKKRVDTDINEGGKSDDDS